MMWTEELKRIGWNGLRKQKGFLMVEVLLAILIISIALTAATSMFIQSTKSSVSGNEITNATALAQKQIELLKTQPASYWNNLAAPPQTIAWQDSAQTMPVTKNNISYTVTTTTANTALDSNLVQVTVAVSWAGQSISMVTFFSKTQL